MSMLVAGVPVLMPTPQLVALIRNHMDARMAHPFYRRAWPGAGSVCLGYPLQHRPIPPVEVGRIYWRGTNASEFSYGYLLASGSQTSQIAAQAFKSFTSSGGGASSDLNPITIVIRSEGVR